MCLRFVLFRAVVCGHGMRLFAVSACRSRTGGGRFAGVEGCAFPVPCYPSRVAKHGLGGGCDLRFVRLYCKGIVRF